MNRTGALDLIRQAQPAQALTLMDIWTVDI